MRRRSCRWHDTAATTTRSGRASLGSEDRIYHDGNTFDNGVPLGDRASSVSQLGWSSVYVDANCVGDWVSIRSSTSWHNLSASKNDRLSSHCLG
ncbi:hypothetical protein [Actinokineospora spheciospongiae]|uniref:hypothetical protein n=1 Tax=Actinokineospora spheciospongiae TaxID=909613 RepID=UPI000D71185F|nr:hypothetical protein [Actinokineospora spheciospongiae]PWW63118.1 hypothetical protein DFQ13_104108 [Actinokineospora spheciospongiae]